MSGAVEGVANPRATAVKIVEAWYANGDTDIPNVELKRLRDAIADALTTPPARSYADEDVARIIDPDAWLLRAGWIEIAEDPKCAEMRDHWMARADGCVAQSLAKAAAIRLLSQGGKA